MPDFDKDLNPILLNTDSNPINLPNPATDVELNLIDLSGRRGPAASATDSFFGNGPVVSNMLPTVSSKELYDNRRYGVYSADTIDIEDQKAYAQSNWDKAANGVLKGLNLAATTVAGSFGMLLGAAKVPFSGRLADIWDNPIMRRMDEWNNEVDQVYLPNYYTNVENDAAWYSTDNWFKANWVFDKLVKNSGFAVGAMVSGNIANAGLLRAGAALGRYATAGAVAAEASQGFKLFTPLLKNAARAFSAGKNLEAAAVLEKELSSIADISASSSKLAEIAKQTSKFAEFGNTGRRTLIAAYSSAGESSFEALSTSNEFRNNLISEYKDTHGGVEPTGGDLQTINEKAEEVGKISFFGNLALLGVTEFVQLPKLLGSTYSSSKQASNSLLGKVDDVILKDSKYIAAPTSVTKFGKLYDKVVGVGKYAFDIKEAGQEVGQYALQVGTQNYFNKANETGNADAWVDGFLYGFGGTNKEGEGVGAFVSKEGAESALMGGLTGGLMQARGTFLEDRATKSNTQKLISQLNTVPSFQKAFKERLDAANRGIVLQQQQQSAVVQGDKLEAKDLDSDMLHNYLAPRIKYGRFDMVMDDILDLKTQAMTNKGLDALKEEGMANINDTVDSFLARIAVIEKTAEGINDLYKSTNLRFGGEVDETGKRLYPDEVIDRMIYAASKVADYDFRIPQVGARIANSGISIDEALTTSVLGSSEEAKKAEDVIMSKIDELNSTNADELKSEFKQVVELNLRRKKFLDEYNEIKEKPQEYTPPEVTEEEKKLIEEEVAGAPKKLLRVRTKDGDRDLEIGTEYFLGRKTKKDKDGNPVYGFPRITILGETEKGLVQVKDINGKIHFLTKAEIATFKLGKVSSTLADKKAKWFLDNVNNQFAFKRKGGKKPLIGRLEYNPEGRILDFVYTDYKGEEQTIEVTGDQFIPQKGYANALITKVGEYTVAEQKALEEFKEEVDTRKTDKLTNRFNIINNVYQKTKASLEEVNKRLDANRKKLEDAEEALANINKTAKGLPRKSFTKAIRATIDSLANTKKTLEDENAELENQQDELETNIAYFRDMMDNLGELPGERGIIDELKDDVKVLQELIDHTTDTIKNGKSLLESVEAALTNALSLFNDFVRRLKEENPDTPLFLQQFQEKIEKFLGEEGARLFVEQKLGYTEAVLDLEDQMDTFKDELKIPELTNKVDKLKEQLSELQSGIKDLLDEHRAKAIILSAFEDAAERYRAQKSEEERMRNNEALMGELMGSADPGLQTRTYDKAYEAESKKSDPSVVLSTITPSKSEQPHVKRANLFGINFGKFTQAKKDKTKGVVITIANEADYGLAGLTQHLKDVSDAPEEEKAKIDPKKTVVFVVVAETKSGSYRPVNVNGDVIEDSGETITFDNAIYQTFPDPKLQWSAEYGGKSMFRDDQAEDRQATIEYYKKEYSEWHADALANPSNAPHSFEASFGTPTVVTRKDESGNDVKDYDASTSVEEAGLITEAELRTRPVIYIPTTNKVVSKGSTFFDSPLGRPFLSLRNAYVKLQNRRLTKKEAETIYEAIYRLSVDVYEKGNAKSDESRRLFNWLKSIVYWGSPKNATGYNSIFFEKTDQGLMLFISGKGKSFPFTPTKIIDNKAEILAGIGLMYNNINYTMVSSDSALEKWKDAYEEIVSISPDGQIETREWQNYQTYLLSREGRKSDEPLPLSTQIVPYKEDAPNRDGVYFTLTDTADTERYSNPPKPVTIVAAAPTVIPATLAPVAPGAPAPKASAPIVTSPAPIVKMEGEFDIDGGENKIAVGDHGVVTFTIDGKKYIETDGKEGFDIVELKGATVQSLMDKLKISKEQATQNVANYIISKVNPQLEASKKAPEAPVVETKTPASTDATTDIEKRRQESLNSIVETYDKGRDLSIGTATITKIDGTKESISDLKDVVTTGDPFQRLKDSINARYKELAALEENKSTTKFSQSFGDFTVYEGSDGSYDVLDNAEEGVIAEYVKTKEEAILIAKKADIEKRRKEYLSLPIIKVEEKDTWMYNLGTFMTKDGEFNGVTSEDVIKKINAKYNAELTALEGVKSVSTKAETSTPTTRTVTLTADEVKAAREQMKNSRGARPPERKIIQEQIRKFKPENWKQVEAWLKANFPNLPVYRVKNAIQGVNGAQAWGMFKDGAIYIYENAEVGTAYHEVFHAVWRMFSDPVEQVAVMNEFKKRSGSFVDRPTGQTIKYSEATDIQIEEQLAEEFRDYVQYKKIPQKPASGRPYIVKLFLDLVNFIKEFFVGRNADTNTEKLFEKIGTGYYKQFNSNEYSLAFAKEGIIDIEEAYASSDSAFRVKDIPADQVHDIMQEMTYSTLIGLIKDNKSLFSIPKLTKKDLKELYEKLLVNMQELALLPAQVAEEDIEAKIITAEEGALTIANSFSLWKKITDEWEEIKKKHQEYLKTYDIEFDEDATNMSKDEDNSGKEDYQDARKIDVFKKANGAIKILLSTIPIVNNAGDLIPSSVNGAKLLPTSQVFMALMNNLHTSTSIDEMMKRLREMAKSDPNYRTLYKRLTNTSYKTDTLDLADINEVHDGQLLSAFWRVFKKQNPDVKNVYIFENGEIEIGDSNLSNAARQVSREYVEAFKKMITEKNPYFEYSTSKKAYIGLADGTKAIREAFKKAKTNSDTLDIMISFLGSMGIEFKKEEIVKLPRDKQDAFKFAVNGILSSIEKSKSVATVTGKVLDLEGRFMGLSTIRAAINNPEFDSTFFNVKGERMQAFIGTNTASDLFEALSKLTNKREILSTPYAYLITDEFSQFSVIIDKMFDSETGDRISGSEDLMKVGYADGTVNMENGKKKESSSLNYKERLIQEINLNLKGWYYNLVPGDASIEWMTKMGNHVSVDRLLSGFGDVHKIFKGYFISELALSRKNRTIVAGEKRSERDLRFLKPILENYDKSLHNDILNATGTELEVYERFKSKINNAVEAFITKESTSLKNTLREYGILTFKPETGYQIENIAFAEKENVSEGTLNRQLNAVSINYMINNIEFHKILYSDPYQYSDELKRIKNFNSPRQAIVNGSAAMNAAYQKIWNKNYKPGDIGYTNFTDDFFRTATLEDVIGRSDLKDYGTFEETDGGGVISMKALRQFKIRAGEWNSDNELQYEYDIAYEKVVKGLPLNAKEKSFNIRKFENQDGSISYIGKNPDIKSTYTPIKPIVAGNKGNGRLYNDVLLDKFALYPLSFRIMHTINANSNAVKQYEKMAKENIDYVVFATGRKVGAEKLNPIYNPTDGSFNNDEYEGIINVPFGIMSIQSEVPSKDTTDVSRGSQVTKLVTMDYMEAGVPVDFEIKDKPKATFTEKYNAWFDLKTEEAKEAASPIYKEIRNNRMLLEELMDESYNQLLKKLGIEETIVNGRKEFNITDFSKAAETLRAEIMKREVNDNINDALAGFLKGEAVLEATPAYQQVRNILYSIADKNVISPKMNGGLKVQISSTFLESVKAKPIEFTNKKGVTKYSYESDTLDFYKDEDGKRVCEIIVGRWFKSDMTDADLLNYLNNTKEGQKILEGVAFRIPTQKQNSIDVFRIKQFMPREFGDSVIIPSALVKKVGSDFDIDKLSLYFKNVLVNAKGLPVIVPFFGYGEQAKKKINNWLIENELSSLSAKEDADAIDNLSEEDEDKDISEIDKYYKKSLQNAYIESMQNLITHPKNFTRLTTPNSADQLKDLAKKVTKQLGFDEFDYSATGNMLSRRFMSRLRHAFVTGKYAIGIAAVNQTNHSLNQRQPIYVDFDRFDNVSDTDKKWLTGGTGKQEDLRIKFKDFNRLTMKGKMVATLSMIRNAEKSEKYPDGQDISDIIGQFIDGYVDISKGPWIMELGATPNVASTFLFLVKIGVPIEQVAYFMNQPIIRDYLRSIESAGYSYLFMDKFVKDIKEKYKTASGVKFEEIPSAESLYKTIGAKELTPEQNAEQQFILDEFLKYSKMAEHMFQVTQGSNFDTSTFNDPYLVFKKMMQLIKARKSIISSVDDLLKNSFIGKMSSYIYDIRDAFAEILKSDNPTVRNVVQRVLVDYIDIPDRDFVRVAQKAVNDLFDWAVQVDIKLNSHVQSILLGTDTTNSAARQIYDVIKPIQDNISHPLHNNVVVKNLVPRFAEKTGQVNNLKIKNSANKIYDQNQMIYAFQELEKHLDLIDKSLYKKLIALSVLQSGLTSSPISFTSLLPYEDFKKIYNKTLSTLETFPDLANFANLNVFQRNNWNNDEIVPYKKAKLTRSFNTGRSYYRELAFGDVENIENDIRGKKIPQVIKLSALSRESNNDIITYSWEVDPDVTDADKRGGIKNAKQKKLKMRKEGDFSFIRKGLFRKVMVGNDPLVHPDRKGNPQYIYKMINAWGDSFRANEFYDSARKSVVENGYIKVDKEIDDLTIAAYFKVVDEKEISTITPEGLPTIDNNNQNNCG